MKTLLVVSFIASATVAFAGQPKIIETEQGIYVEYTGTPTDAGSERTVAPGISKASGTANPADQYQPSNRVSSDTAAQDVETDPNAPVKKNESFAKDGNLQGSSQTTGQISPAARGQATVETPSGRHSQARGTMILRGKEIRAELMSSAP